MGIRGLEHSLAAELCYEAVVGASQNYLDDCREADRVLPASEYLIGPILHTGFYPPGLLGIQAFIDRESRAIPRAVQADVGLAERLPDLDRLIEAIMAPYPVSRLRKAGQRAMRQAQT